MVCAVRKTELEGELAKPEVFEYFDKLKEIQRQFESNEAALKAANGSLGKMWRWL